MKGLHANAHRDSLMLGRWYNLGRFFSAHHFGAWNGIDTLVEGAILSSSKSPRRHTSTSSAGGGTYVVVYAIESIQSDGV